MQDEAFLFADATQKPRRGADAEMDTQIAPAKLERVIAGIRHIQLHAGELYERLGNRTRVKLRWAGHVHRKPK
jgi:hypothetical protein